MDEITQLHFGGRGGGSSSSAGHGQPHHHHHHWGGSLGAAVFAPSPLSACFFGENPNHKAAAAAHGGGSRHGLSLAAAGGDHAVATSGAHAEPHKIPTSSSSLPKGTVSTATGCMLLQQMPPAEVDAIKAKIVSHPHYSALVAAYLDCQKVGAPPEAAARLTAASELAARQCTSAVHASRSATTTEPELDQFMEAYHEMLVKYREELTRPLQEAMEFLKRVESQLNTLSLNTTNTTTASSSSQQQQQQQLRIISSASSEDDREASSGENELPVEQVDARGVDQELKHHLLMKYSGYLSTLKQEFSKKKKKGKLPKEARQQLLSWWDMHYKWPYPSENQKAALAEATGLNLKQINNWFINQRKRHWKPTDEMHFVMMDAGAGGHAGGVFHPAAAASASFYMDGHFVNDGLYQLAP